VHTLFAPNMLNSTDCNVYTLNMLNSTCVHLCNAELNTCVMLKSTCVHLEHAELNRLRCVHLVCSKHAELNRMRCAAVKLRIGRRTLIRQARHHCGAGSHLAVHRHLHQAATAAQHKLVRCSCTQATQAVGVKVLPHRCARFACTHPSLTALLALLFKKKHTCV